MLLISMVLMLNACDGIDLENIDLSGLSEEDINKVIVCDPPYMRFGASCCLDQNDNSICDDDECNTDDDCNLLHATPVCSDDGTCQIYSCDEGYASCNSEVSGCEAQFAIDVNNCGECDNACADGEVCNNGECEGNECTSADDCSFAHATPTCDEGYCQMYSCDSGYASCDQTGSNGCEAYLDTDTDNCGECGTACADGEACVSGVCAGTECTTADDCDYAHATPTCSGGYCQMYGCDNGYSSCDSDGSNGCEAYLDTDTDNCGECDNACADGETCSNGLCEQEYECATADDCDDGSECNVASCVSRSCVYTCDDGAECTIGRSTGTCTADRDGCECEAI